MKLADMTPQDMIELIANRASGFAQQAGVGAMETAGALLSYLADHPKDLEPFVNGGIFELPSAWIERGSLTWQAMNGDIVTPEYARHARIVSKIKAGDA